MSFEKPDFLRTNKKVDTPNPCLILTDSYDLDLDQIRDLTAERLRYVIQIPLMQRHLSDQVRDQRPGTPSCCFIIHSVIHVATSNRFWCSHCVEHGAWCPRRYHSFVMRFRLHVFVRSVARYNSPEENILTSIFLLSTWDIKTKGTRVGLLVVCNEFVMKCDSIQ